MLVGSSRDRGEVKGQVFETGEMLACMKAKRGSARRAKKAARRERVKFWSRWQKMELAEHKWGDWPETVKGAPPPL